MSCRLAERAPTLCPGTTPGQRVSLHLYITCITLLLISWPLPGFSATPAGTVISNMATLTYTVSGTPGLPLSSNTDQFPVANPAAMNNATMTVAPFGGKLYVGTTHSVTLDLTNCGSNTLADHRLRISAPPGSQIDLAGTGVSLISTAANTSATTGLFLLPDLASTQTQHLQLSLTLPLSAEPSTSQLSLEHLANGVTLNTQAITLHTVKRTQGQLETLQYSHSSTATPVVINATRYQNASGNYAPMAAPALPDTSGCLVTAAPVPLEVTDQFSHQQIIFLRVNDPDHNLDSTSAETIVIKASIVGNGESEVLQLRETGPDSGTFTGYLTLAQGSPQANNGCLDVHPQTEVALNYSDEIDASDSSVTLILIDPFGEVFDSATGQKLNGYTVQMVNSDSGLPAVVYGDDGTSLYPAAMATGGAVTDSSGKVYAYGTGEYRFPASPAGNYKLVVSIPSGAKYSWPSTRSTELLTKLPIDYLVITAGSRGESFPLLPGAPLHIDIPVDPLTTQLYVQRSANRESVAAGDFIRYSVTLENITPVALHGVVLTESLPHGFRLQKGSVTINGNRAADPVIATDGTTFTFDFGTLTSGQSKKIEYLAAVGAVHQGEASSHSHAIANFGAAESNTAVHTVKVFDDLMHDRALLLGQVFIDDAEKEAGKASGLAGARIYLEDGRYAITDEDGRYHFDDILPGSHVVQLDLDTIPDAYEVIRAEANTRFAGRAWSQFVDLQGGTLWRTDFHLAPKATPTGNLSLQISNQPLHENGTLTYQIALAATTVAVSNMRLTVMLPENTRYQTGSSRFAGQTLADPTIVSNKMLTWNLGNGSGEWEKELSFTIDTANASGANELTTKAYIVFDTAAKPNQRLPVTSHVLPLVASKAAARATSQEFIISPHYRLGSVALSSEDKAGLDTIAEQVRGLKEIRIHAVGHTDNTPLQRPETIKNYGDNYRLSEGRAREVAEYLRAVLHLPAERIVVEGKGPDQPIASNSTEQGRVANRRVQLTISSDNEMEHPPATSGEKISDKQSTVIAGQNAGSAQAATAPAAKKGERPIYDGAWLATQNADAEWLLPAEESIPAIPSIDITIKHQAAQQVTLAMNGRPVPAINFNGTTKNDKGPALSNWSGVDLAEGDNLFTATITGKGGGVAQEIRRNVHYSGPPVGAEIVTDKSTLIADGKTNPVIAVRLYDKDKYPLHAGVNIEYSLNYPYQPARNHELLTDKMAGAPGNRTYVTVGDNGIALLKLEPSNDTDDLVITLSMAGNKTVALKSRLKTKAREWILVGLAEGAAGYNTLSGHLESLDGNAAQDHLYADDRVAFFAKGQVLGKWLLTMAYDSDKERPQKNGNDPRLFQAIEPARYYTVYGDAGQNGFGAPSTDKIYLKLERDEFYCLYGDFETGFTDTKLARYERTLTGIKSRYQDERYNLIIFASETNQTFVKDEFRGQGSTGPYQLSRRDVAMNSERVTIEGRDRFRSEVIVSSRELARYADYDINYGDGTITFREPVFSNDASLNPQYIVVRYEAYASTTTRLTAGGRAEMKVTDKLKVGVTQVTEGRAESDAQLGGFDLRYQHSDNLKVRLEAGRTRDKKEGAETVAGNAYLVEMEYQTINSTSKVSFHDTDSRFGLGQTSASEIGMRKSSVETTVRAMPNLNLKGQAYRLENTAMDASRTLGEALGELTLGNTSLRAGLREVQDELSDSSRQRSSQILTGLSQSLFDSKVILRADRESNLNGGDNSLDFPNLTRVGADYHITDSTTLYAEHEIADGSILNTRHSRMGVKATPWNGGAVYSGLTRSNGTTGDTTSANLAVHQIWQLNKAWSLDVGAEESKLLSQTLGLPFTDLNSGFTPGLKSGLTSGFANSGSSSFSATPFGIDEDFTAASLGVTYNHTDWLWTARAESRIGSITDRRNIATSVQTSPQNNLSLFASFNHTESDRNAGDQQEFSDLLLGLAYRPRGSRWLLLDKLELMTNEIATTTKSDESWRIINLCNANYKTGPWQTSFQYGAKTVTETIDSTDYSQFVDLTGIESRYDINEQWDIGVQANILHAWTLNHYDYSSGISIGHTIADNVWISVGYNFIGFRDEDFSRSNYTSQGVFIKFRLKFDQLSVKEGLEWLKR